MADRDVQGGQKGGQKEDEPGEQHRAGYGKGMGNYGTAGNQDQDFPGQGGFVDHAFEPGGRYDEESGILEEERQKRENPQGLGGYAQGGGGDLPGYGGFTPEGDATTGFSGYDRGDLAGEGTSQKEGASAPKGSEAPEPAGAGRGAGSTSRP
jgi:hypothetical protein